MHDLTAKDVELLNKVLATVLAQAHDQAHGFPVKAPRFCSRELCRLRAKIAPHIGVTESIQGLKIEDGLTGS